MVTVHIHLLLDTAVPEGLSAQQQLRTAHDVTASCKLFLMCAHKPRHVAQLAWCHTAKLLHEPSSVCVVSQGNVFATAVGCLPRLLPHVGMVTILMNDYPYLKFLLIGVLGRSKGSFLVSSLSLRVQHLGGTRVRVQYALQKVCLHVACIAGLLVITNKEG
jgi:hypothetical protein